MTTLVPLRRKDDEEKEPEFEFFPSKIISYMTKQDAKSMYDPLINGSLSCSLTIGMLLLSMIFAFGVLTTIYWFTVPVVRYALQNDNIQMIYLYFVYIPLIAAISWLIIVILKYNTNRAKYDYYDLNLVNDFKYIIWIYILFVFNPIYLRWRYISLCISYCRLYQSALYYSINSFIHQYPKEMMERIIAIHYYLTNRYYQLWITHIVKQLKDGNGNLLSPYKIGTTVEKFTTGIKDFKRALNDKQSRKNMDSLTLARDIEKKLKFTYDEKVLQLFPVLELVSKEVESNISAQCDVDKDQFDEIVRKSVLEQKGAFRHAFISFDFMPYKIISSLVFIAYFILNWYVLLTLYDGSQSFAENTRHDMLLPSLYDFILILAGIALLFIDKRYMVQDTLFYIVRFYGDWNRIEDLLIINEHETIYDIFEQKICPIYCYYGSRFIVMQLSVQRFGDDVGSIIIQFLYGNNNTYEKLEDLVKVER